jgi:hypothetical protein
LRKRARRVKFEEFLRYLAIGILSIFFSVAFHESMHVLTALANGCFAGIQELNWMFGVSGVTEKCPKEALMKIAISAPILSFFAGLFFWFAFGKDSEARLLAISLFAYSVLPNLIPTVPTTDFAKAVEFGLPLWFAWGFLLFATGTIFYLISREVLEKE